MTAALGHLNFRDLGGIAVAGGRLRPGLLYRSEGPAGFSPANDAALAALGVRLVCDLRSVAERQASAERPGWSARALTLDIAADFRSGRDTDWIALGPGLTGEVASRTMRRTYAAMVPALQPHLAGLVRAMLAGDLPLLIHCTAGKDRTGVLVALILLMLGAEREAIVADYLLSASFAARPENRARIGRQLARVLGVAVDDDVVDAVIRVDESYLDAALAAVCGAEGPPDRFLAAAGIDGLTVQALRRILVAPAGA